MGYEASPAPLFCLASSAKWFSLSDSLCSGHRMIYSMFRKKILSPVRVTWHSHADIVNVCLYTGIQVGDNRSQPRWWCRRRSGSADVQRHQVPRTTVLRFLSTRGTHEVVFQPSVLSHWNRVIPKNILMQNLLTSIPNVHGCLYYRAKTVFWSAFSQISTNLNAILYLLLQRLHLGGQFYPDWCIVGYNSNQKDFIFVIHKIYRNSSYKQWIAMLSWKTRKCLLVVNSAFLKDFWNVGRASARKMEEFLVCCTQPTGISFPTNQWYQWRA